jgi:hypothetical protein
MKITKLPFHSPTYVVNGNLTFDRKAVSYSVGRYRVRINFTRNQFTARPFKWIMVYKRA